MLAIRIVRYGLTFISNSNTPLLSCEHTLAEDRDRQPLPRIPWMLGIRPDPPLLLLTMNALTSHQRFKETDTTVFSSSCFQKLFSCRFKPDLSCTYAWTSLNESPGHFCAEHCTVWALQGGLVLSSTYIKVAGRRCSGLFAPSIVLSGLLSQAVLVEPTDNFRSG